MNEKGMEYGECCGAKETMATERKDYLERRNIVSRWVNGHRCHFWG
jgi:endonuclease I